MISNPIGLLAILSGIAAFFLGLEKKTKWKFFNYFPPLLFIYAVPLILSNTQVIACQSSVYDWMSEAILPLFIILMLIDVDIAAAVKTIGRGVFVMLFGTAGVVLGAPIAYFIVKHGLSPDAWKGFGSLAGSWIGGSGNMAAASEALKTPPADFGLAVLADNMIYIVWLPILLGSKNFADRFNRFTKVDKKRIEMLENSSESIEREHKPFEMIHLLYLLFLGFFFPWLASILSECLPQIQPVLTAGSWKILLVTTFGILLSLTPAKKIPGSHSIAVALVYLFVANMGARADISGLTGNALWFLLGAYIWIAIHGLLCLLGAKLFKVDLHSTAIASAANVGGIASAPIVAAHHNPKLVPVSILMALIGYAVGNYGALAAAWLCYLVS